MYFKMGGISVIGGFRNGFGVDLSTNDGFLAVITEDDEIDGDLVDTTGFMLLLPFCYLTIQWCV